jgi:hypothetical protein
MVRKWALVLVAVVAAAALSLVPVGGGRVRDGRPGRKAGSMDLTEFPDTKPLQPLRLLFIHHSVGGQLLAAKGPHEGANSIHGSHPNGGGLRPALTEAGYEVHEASYGSRVGERTDLFDWLPKFRTQMDAILTVSNQDQTYPDARRNQIVAFKSCFPNSAYVGEGRTPGTETGPELTVANARATMKAVLLELAKHPETLFVYGTAPPLAPTVPRQPAWKWLAKTLLGRQFDADSLRRSGALARQVNDWLVSPDGWLSGYSHRNVVVFDFHRILTGERSNLLQFPTGDGSDSHPSTAGNARAAARFVPFLNRAVRRAGLSD